MARRGNRLLPQVRKQKRSDQHPCDEPRTNYVDPLPLWMLMKYDDQSLDFIKRFALVGAAAQPYLVYERAMEMINIDVDAAEN